MNVRRHERKAISPIVATVLIVAATLIAFAAVAGYVFGLFGSATSSGTPQTVGESLASGASSAAGFNVTLTNSGGAGVTLQSASVTVGGSSYTASPIAYYITVTRTSVSAGAGAPINPSVNTLVVFGAFGATAPTFIAGTTYTINLSYSNGLTSTVSTTAH